MKKRILAGSLIFAMLFITACGETPEQQAMRTTAARQMESWAKAAEFARLEWMFEPDNSGIDPTFDMIKNNIRSLALVDDIDCDGANVSFNSEGKLVIDGTCKIRNFSCTYSPTEGGYCKR